MAAEIKDIVETSEGYGSTAVETGDDLADNVSDGVDYVINDGQDIASDLADGAGDVADEIEKPLITRSGEYNPWRYLVDTLIDVENA